MQTIKIDFDNPGLPQRLDVVENDAQSRFFKAVLYKDGKAYTAPSGAKYSIMYQGFGPQNEGWYDTINDGAGKRAACSVSGNVVTCEIARQALRVPGHVSVVLCVTGSNGYMLHGWPIDCNCRNDSYTSGTSVESFFYITQITNADWTSAIQTWEELKNMIDPTLSLSGKAADAAKVGEAVNAETTRAKAAEEENAKGISRLNEDIWDINIIPIKNCVEKIDAGHYWDNAGNLVENSGYDAVTIKVNAGKKYSVNKPIGGNNFNLVIGKDGNITEKFTSDICNPIGNGYYFTAPDNAFYLKLSRGKTTYWNTFIVLEGVKDISHYDITDYPIGISVKTKSTLPFQTMNGLTVDEVGKYLSLFNDCKSDNLVPLFTNVFNKYFDGNDFTVKEGYRYYKRNVNANETYKVTALTDDEVPFTFYLLDVNGGVLRKEVDCKDTIIYIEQDGVMIVNSSWKHSLNPVINLMTYDGSKQIIAPRIFYCGKNRKFKKLKDCVEEATKYMDSVVYVDEGVYDLVSEFGTDYLDSYNGTDNIGIELKNRVHVVFSSGATVVFNYTGTNEATQKYFSPFNSGEYGYTLENAWVESVNCRYSVHDERANADDSYHNVYKRCTFIHDSSKATGWHASQAIGGGLGKYGDILIEDCYCKSVGNDDSISYHSPNVTAEENNSKSKIVVNNTYTSGTLCFIPLGNSSRKTPIYVTGCSTRIAPYIKGSTETMELIAWNNEIRSNS